MDSTEVQRSAKPISEKQRLKSEKFAIKQEKQAQQRLQQLGDPPKEKKLKKQNPSTVESRS